MDGVSKKNVFRMFSSAINPRGLLKPPEHSMKRGGLPSHFQISQCNLLEFGGACIEVSPWVLPHP